MNRRSFLNFAVIGAALALPGAGVLGAAGMPQDYDKKEDKEEKKQDKKASKAEKHERIHDAKHGDDHEWNEDEDRYYRQYLSERHEGYRDYEKLNREDQEAYWDWRHTHHDDDDADHHR